MTLLLSNADVEALVTVPECIDLLEAAYRELADGRAVSPTRSDALVPGTQPDTVYMLKTMSAVAPQLGVGAVRINSNILAWPQHQGETRRVKVPATAAGRYVGFVLLFSIATGETLAIFPDGALQRMRVGATNALAAKYLARADAANVALFGSGQQAEAQLVAIAAVRPVGRVRCFSPRAANREAFAARLQAGLGLDVQAVAAPEQAIAGADMVLCATNSLAPIVAAAWLAPGMHLSAIRWHEIPPPALARCRLVIHSHESDPQHFRSRGLAFPDDSDRKGGTVAAGLDIAALPTLPDLIAGRAEGRRTPDEITGFINNHGLGYQFAVIGALLHRRARARQRGHPLPPTWLTQDICP